MKPILYGTSLLALVLAAPAFAAGAGDGHATRSDAAQAARQNQPVQQGMTGATGGRAAAAPIGEWNYDRLYAGGWSVERLFDDGVVLGRNGDEIGDVENVLFDDEGRVLALVAEIGGVWDIGDTHVSIPWDQVKLSANATGVTVPVTEESVEDYTVFGERAFIFEGTADRVRKVDDDLETGSQMFKATDLIGDYAYLDGDMRHGYLNDVIVDGDRIAAVVVDASSYSRPGVYAYPYNRYGAIDPQLGRYTMPYGADEIVVVEPFDYDRLTRGAGDAG